MSYTQHTTKQEIRRLKAILTFEEYEKIVRRVINIAITSENEKSALTAAMYIIDRVEGKVPVDVIVNDNSSEAYKRYLEMKNGNG